MNELAYLLLIGLAIVAIARLAPNEEDVRRLGDDEEK
jgi:hypothetical protein